MKDEFVESCPYCSGREFASGVQSGYSQILGENRIFGAQTLYHVVCLGCGSVVRSYVKKPKKLLTGTEKKNIQGEF